MTNRWQTGVYRVLLDFPGTDSTLVWLSPDGIEAPDADVLVFATMSATPDFAVWRGLVWFVNTDTHVERRVERGLPFTLWPPAIEAK